MKTVNENALEAFDQRTVLTVVVTTTSPTKVTRRKNLFSQTDVAIACARGNTEKLYAVSVMIEFAENEWIDVMPYLQQIALEGGKKDPEKDVTPRRAK